MWSEGQLASYTAAMDVVTSAGLHPGVGLCLSLSHKQCSLIQYIVGFEKEKNKNK